MPRLGHGASITTEKFEAARNMLAEQSANIPLAFAAAIPVDLQDFDFLFLDLQNDPANLLPESRQTRDDLIRLGQTMRDAGAANGDGDSQIPAAYTYFGQFVDHDVTLETVSATTPQLLDPNLAPRGLDDIRTNIRNPRTATLDLDSIYGLPALRDPGNSAKMLVGRVTSLNGTEKPLLRPPGKTDDNDVPREPRATDPEHDRAALIGDPRNDENTIIGQLHVAFLRAHNALVDQGQTFDGARTLLRQHYQHIILQDFLMRIADPQIVGDVIQNGNRVYDAMAEPFFLPLEYAVAAYRFGHTMVRADCDFNLNFNKSGEPGTIPATLGLLFTFTALSGELGDHDTLPDNWIIQWENVVDVGDRFTKARKFDTKLVEPLFELRDVLGNPEPGDAARLAVRNLLRGYLLRMPTGQAVAQFVRDKLKGIHEIPVLSREQIIAGAASDTQAQVLREGGFLERTPLWYYILAEASAVAGGQHLGPIGSVIVAEVLVGLVRRSEDSILRTPYWKPSLPSTDPGSFTLLDLLRLAGIV